MSDETLLTYLVARLGSGPENVATETLAFILRTPAAATGMGQHIQRFCTDLASIATYQTQDWSADDEAVPDVVGRTVSGSTPLVVEAKFGAALTPNQPVTYLRRLLALDEPTLLLFLVP